MKPEELISKPQRFKKKPVEVEAVRYTDSPYNRSELSQFLGDVEHGFTEDGLLIRTLEGVMKADKGDWIIKGVKGEFYPCKPSIFEQTYEAV